MKLFFLKKIYILIVVLNVNISFISAQVLEKIVVEKYGIIDSLGQKRTYLPAGAICYRIYADLDSNSTIQSIYGDENHTLIFQTTTSFYNHPYGNSTGDAIPDMFLLDPELAFDSWFTLGAASKCHIGIPLLLDSDSSNIKLGIFKNADGIVRSTIPSYLKHEVEVAAFDAVGGNLFKSNNSLIGVLGGIKGATSDNYVLLAQLTTDGEIYFEINLQVGDKKCGVFKRYVAKNPIDENEVLFEDLIYKTVSIK